MAKQRVRPKKTWKNVDDKDMADLHLNPSEVWTVYVPGASLCMMTSSKGRKASLLSYVVWCHIYKHTLWDQTQI